MIQFLWTQHGLWTKMWQRNNGAWSWMNWDCRNNIIRQGKGEREREGAGERVIKMFCLVVWRKKILVYQSKLWVYLLDRFSSAIPLLFHHPLLFSFHFCFSVCVCANKYIFFVSSSWERGLLELYKKTLFKWHKFWSKSKIVQFYDEKKRSLSLHSIWNKRSFFLRENFESHNKNRIAENQNTHTHTQQIYFFARFGFRMYMCVKSNACDKVQNKTESETFQNGNPI